MFRTFKFFTKRNMSSLDLLNKRLEYYGGSNQQTRMINDKLRSLKKSLLYSYQAATATLADKREFRCLINPDKNKPAYDNKILSIPYKDICLNKSRVGKTSEGEEEIGIKPGDVFTQKETSAHWLVYLQYTEEKAYFRSEIRRCDQQVEINGNSYWVYIRGPVETSIEWSQKAGIEWNTLNYSLVMYITSDEVTNDYFYRFKTIKIIDPRNNTKKTWQVVGVDPYYGDGILQVFLDEYFENSIKDAAAVEKSQENTIGHGVEPYIDGPTTVPQYSKAYYSINNVDNWEQGHWYLRWNNTEQDLNSSKKIIPLDISIGDLGTFTLIYRLDEQEDVTLDVTIAAL